MGRPKYTSNRTLPNEIGPVSMMSPLGSQARRTCVMNLFSSMAISIEVSLLISILLQLSLFFFPYFFLCLNLKKKIEGPIPNLYCLKNTKKGKTKKKTSSYFHSPQISIILGNPPILHTTSL